VNERRSYRREPPTAVLISGGLDSAVLLGELIRERSEVTPIYVRSGHVWEEVELVYLRRLLEADPLKGCAPLAVLSLPVEELYDGHWSVTGVSIPGFQAAVESNYLPGRNLLLLSKVAVFCALRGIERVALAILSDNPFPDGKLEFFAAFTRAACLGLAASLDVDVPFRHLRKADVIRRAGLTFPFELTMSCLQPVDLVHCGECTKCAERRAGFAEAEIRDQTRYRKTGGRTS
jgi:7-cyano-7-deazaguanine synthase